MVGGSQSNRKLGRVTALSLCVVFLLACVAACSGGHEDGPLASTSPEIVAPESTVVITVSPSPTPVPTTVPVTPTPQPKRVDASSDEVLHGPTDRPRLSLVINVGAGFEPAVGVFDVLAKARVHTTFFVLGWWAERNPGLLTRIAAEGHEIASHGHSVLDLTAVSDGAVRVDLEAADTVISAITGRSTKPLWSPSAGYRDARVRGIAASLGYRPIIWSQDSGDWRVDATFEQVRRAALAGIEPGAIIVFHFDSTKSAVILPAIIREVIDVARSRGLEPVTITELIGN